MYEHYKGLMADSFDSSPGFRAVLDEACKSFVNAVPQASEWLARYAHCLLDKVCMPPLVLLSAVVMVMFVELSAPFFVRECVIPPHISEERSWLFTSATNGGDERVVKSAPLLYARKSGPVTPVSNQSSFLFSRCCCEGRCCG